MLKSYVINISERKMFFTSDVSFRKLIITVIKSLSKSTDYQNFCTILQENIAFDKVIDIRSVGAQDIPTLKSYSAINIFYKQKLISYADDKYSFMFSKNGTNHLSLRTNTHGYLKVWSGEFKGDGQALNDLVGSYFSGICSNDKEEKEVKRDSNKATVIASKIINARAVSSNLTEAVKSQVDLSQQDEVTKIITPKEEIKETFVPKSELSTELMNSLINERLEPDTGVN